MKKVVTVSLPFNEAELDQYFDNLENYGFVVDFSKCSYKGKKLLNYIYNSGMVCEFRITAFDSELEDILLAYIAFDRPVNVPVLNDIWCNALSVYLGAELQTKEPGYLKFIQKMIAEHENVFQELVNVLYSMKLHMTHVARGDSGILEGAKERKQECTGRNIVSLRRSRQFWDMLVHTDEKGTAYNYQLFQDFCYQGKRLSSIFLSEFNPFTMIQTLLAESEEKEKGAASLDEENH